MLGIFFSFAKFLVRFASKSITNILQLVKVNHEVNHRIHHYDDSLVNLNHDRKVGPQDGYYAKLQKELLIPVYRNDYSIDTRMDVIGKPNFNDRIINNNQTKK